MALISSFFILKSTQWQVEKQSNGNSSIFEFHKIHKGQYSNSKTFSKSLATLINNSESFIEFEEDEESEGEKKSNRFQDVAYFRGYSNKSILSFNEKEHSNKYESNHWLTGLKIYLFNSVFRI